MRARSTLPVPPALAALVLAAGCSSPKLVTNLDPGTDTSAYRTYGFVSELGTDGQEYSSLLSQFLKDATTRELEARGFEPSASPDLLVNFYVQTKEKIYSTPSPSLYYGYRSSGPWSYGGGFGYDTVSQYTEGTLNVDFVDRGQRRVVWEAALIGRVTDDDREHLKETVDRAIAEVFEEFPFTPGGGAPRGPDSARAEGREPWQAFVAPADAPRVDAAAVVEAQYALGLLSEEGEGVPLDPAEAARWYRAAAERGHPGAQTQLARLCLEGRGVDRDPAEAARWLHSAAEQGVPAAQAGLGLLYAEGVGVPRDDARAVHWLRLAAEQDLPDAQAGLGLAYLHGRGVAADDARAAGWLRRAAEQGHATAQSDLALLHLQGRGVERDPVEAARWMRLAAEQGVAEAQSRLGTMYELGRGVERDEVAALVWYGRAAAQGQRAALERRSSLAGRVSPEQVEEAARRARDGRS